MMFLASFEGRRRTGYVLVSAASADRAREIVSDILDGSRVRVGQDRGIHLRRIITHKGEEEKLLIDSGG